LALAKKLNKPVSIHCVRAFGHIVDIFRSQDCPEKIMMHSFGGNLRLAIKDKIEKKKKKENCFKSTKKKV